MRVGLLAVAVLGCGAAPVATVSPTPAPAADCAFHHSEPVPSRAWPSPVPPAVLAAVEHFEAGRHEAAAMAAADVLARDGLSAAERGAALLVLSRAYGALGLHLSSVAAANELAFSVDTAPELAGSLALLRDDLVVFAREPELTSSVRSTLAHDVAPADPAPALALLLARDRRDDGDLAAATALVDAIPEAAPEWLAGRWLAAELAIRASDLAVAAHLFDELTASDPCDARRDLAALSLARVAFDHAVSGAEHPGTELANAFVLAQRVDPNGSYAEDAALLRGWIGRWLDQPAIGRRELTAIGPAYRLLHPEVDLLDATLAVNASDAAAARTAIDRVRAVAATVEPALRATFASDRDAEALLADVEARLASEPTTPIDEAIRTLCAGVDEVATARAAIEASARIDATLARLSAEFVASPPGQRVLQDAFIMRSFAVDQGADAVRRAANVLLEEVLRAAGQADELALLLDSIAPAPP